MELLVVIAIIGILAALLLAVISKGDKKAQSIVCANNVRQLGQAVQLFVTTKRVYLLDINPRNLTASSYPDHGSSWIESVGDELGQIVTNRALKGVWIYPSAAKRPSEDTGKALYSCYGYNANGMAAQNDLACSNNIGRLCRQKGLGWRPWAGLGGGASQRLKVFDLPRARRTLVNEPARGRRVCVGGKTRFGPRWVAGPVPKKGILPFALGPKFLLTAHARPPPRSRIACFAG